MQGGRKESREKCGGERKRQEEDAGMNASDKSEGKEKEREWEDEDRTEKTVGRTAKDTDERECQQPTRKIRA